MKNIVSLIPWPWRIALFCGLLALLGIVGGLAAWGGYDAGYDKAKALGDAEIAQLISDHATAYADAMAELNNKLQEETERAMAVGYALASGRLANAKTEADLRTKIAGVTRDSTHVFSFDFVRVWNEAVGAAGGDHDTAAHSAGGVDGTPGAGATPDSGVLARVTEADVLAYIIYYGRRSKDLEAQVNGWIDLAEGWKK